MAGRPSSSFRVFFMASTVPIRQYFLKKVRIQELWIDILCNYHMMGSTQELSPSIWQQSEGWLGKLGPAAFWQVLQDKLKPICSSWLSTELRLINLILTISVSSPRGLLCHKINSYFPLEKSNCLSQLSTSLWFVCLFWIICLWRISNISALSRLWLAPYLIV